MRPYAWSLPAALFIMRFLALLPPPLTGSLLDGLCGGLQMLGTGEEMSKSPPLNLLFFASALSFSLFWIPMKRLHCLSPPGGGSICDISMLTLWPLRPRLQQQQHRPNFFQDAL